MTVSVREQSRLHRSCGPLVQSHPGKSGIFALPDGLDAFAARVLLAGAAEHTLDVQYYIWHHDMSGTLLFEALHRAADRGVRVRLLLDDNNTSGLDATIAAFDAHPNMEVRLFNAFKWRRWRLLSYLTDFRRLNRRMHNKSFTADGQATIIGGRNIGDEYFGAGQEISFMDLDVLAVGPVVEDVTADFERYWTSASATRATQVVGTAPETAIAELTAASHRVEHDPVGVKYIHALGNAPFLRDLMDHKLQLEWTDVHMVSDDPAKGLGLAKDSQLLWSQLKEVIKTPVSELLLVSPYFVPGKQGVAEFTALARSGVEITVLTNALEATDVPAVHAGYAKRRKPLLAAGIKLFELKRLAGGRSARGSGLMGSSSSSLHAKTFAVDRERVFVGSFNFDPRSARLNTEMGFVIESPMLAQAIADAFARRIPERAYRVGLTSSGALQWSNDGQRFDQEPGTGLVKRLAVRVLALLPIEWLL
jgi:putative cardiolipin synthase